MELAPHAAMFLPPHAGVASLTQNNQEGTCCRWGFAQELTRPRFSRHHDVPRHHDAPQYSPATPRRPAVQSHDTTMPRSNLQSHDTTMPHSTVPRHHDASQYSCTLYMIHCSSYIIYFSRHHDAPPKERIRSKQYNLLSASQQMENGFLELPAT